MSTRFKKPYGSIAVITGASSGIGLSCVRAFLDAGYIVWGLSRRATLLDRENYNPLSCDVTSEESVKNAVNEIIARSGGIGVLLQCAGFGISGAAEDTPPDAVYRQLETNFHGVLRVNRHVLPHMRAQKRGLTMAIGSIAGLIPIPFQSHYSASKHALEGYMGALRMELRPFGLRACIIEPGDIKTGFTANREPCADTASPYAETCRRAVARMEKDEQGGMPPECVARAAVKLTARKNPPVRRVVGFQYKAIAVLNKLLPSGLVHRIVESMYR